MRMFSACINMKASEKLVSESCFRKHATNSPLDQTLRVFCAKHCRSMLSLSAVITRVSEDRAICPLLASHSNFFSVDYDNMISAVNMGRVACLVLTADNFCYLTSHTA